MLEDDDRALLARVTILVVTYESRHCLEALSPLLSACPQVVLVDNASHDSTAQQAQALWPHARVQVMPRNEGFGAANNAGLRQVSTPLALLLNPDCQLDMGSLLALKVTDPKALIRGLRAVLIRTSGFLARKSRPLTSMSLMK